MPFIIWRKIFGEKTIWAGWWFGVVWTGRSSILPSVHFAIHPCLQITLALNLQEIWSILSPKQQRRPLPSLLYKSFFNGPTFFSSSQAIQKRIFSSLYSQRRNSRKTRRPPTKMNLVFHLCWIITRSVCTISMYMFEQLYKYLYAMANEAEEFYAWF